MGNIRFVSELYKLLLMTARIMHECMKKLLAAGNPLQLLLLQDFAPHLEVRHLPVDGHEGSDAPLVDAAHSEDADLRPKLGEQLLQQEDRVSSSVLRILSPSLRSGNCPSKYLLPPSKAVVLPVMKSRVRQTCRQAP